MDRVTSLQRIVERKDPWDLVIIGGGATGIGIAVDAAARGYAVCLLEQSDFGKGTSSRSTKLVHGGVRYLQQGNLSLVMEALKERGILRHNAPHLVKDLAFIVPNYAWWEAPFYGIGMKVYDTLAFRYGFAHSRHLSKAEVIKHIPTIEATGLRGGVLYHDGQFDDARLLIDLAFTAEEKGAAVINYARVTGFARDSDGLLDAVTFLDLETGVSHSIGAKCVVNATGAFADEVRRLDDPRASAMISPSQGIHLVLPREFLPGDSAIMVPRTSDGRVMFAIPWHDRAVLGTTDTPIEAATLEPVAQEKEIEFILTTAARYMSRPPRREDVLSVFVGIRPLVKAPEGGSEHAGAGAGTAALSRDHTIHISQSGLLTIAGGKWTTYRKMAEDAVDHAATLAGLPERECVTKELRIHGYHPNAATFGELQWYGAAAADVLAIEQEMLLHPRLTVTRAQVIWAARQEMARTVDDVLARRTRSLLLDAKAAVEAAPAVARILADELGKPAHWAQAQVAEFAAMAEVYQLK